MDNKYLEQLIETAVKKINAKKENDICRYLPSNVGEGYIHHFTMRKMKGENPTELAELINKHIINPSEPRALPPKSRAARGSRKRRDGFILTKQDLQKMLMMAEMANDKEMIKKLTPKKDLKAVKKELITSIRHNRIEPELWQLYQDTVAQESGTAVATAEAFAFSI